MTRALAGRLLRSPSTERMGQAARRRVWARVEEGPAPAAALRWQVARLATMGLVVFGSLAVAMATVGRLAANRPEARPGAEERRPRSSAPTQTRPSVATPAAPSAGPAMDPPDDDPGLVYSARLARRPAEALRLVDDYLARFPRGQLRGEAMMVGVSAALSGGREAAARELASRYLAESPDGPHRGVAKRVLGSN